MLLNLLVTSILIENAVNSLNARILNADDITIVARLQLSIDDVRDELQYFFFH